MSDKKTREFNSRWGNAIADDYQYCHVPGYILRNYAKCISAEGQIVGLDMQDMMFVIHVMAFKYDAPNGKATPGLPTIAAYAGLSVNSVRRIKQRLMDYGLLTIETFPGKPDVYNFGGLHDQCARMEQGLAPIEGVEILTPHKNVRGNNFERGRADKNVRATPPKSMSRRTKGNSEGKKENKKNITQKDCDALIDIWASVVGLEGDVMGADYHTRSARRHAKEMLLWKIPPTRDEIETIFKDYGKDFIPFEFLSSAIIKLRARPIAPVDPAHVLFVPPAEADTFPPPPEVLTALKQLSAAMCVNDEVYNVKQPA